MPSTMCPSASNTGAQKPPTPGSSVFTTRAAPCWRASSSSAFTACSEPGKSFRPSFWQRTNSALSNASSRVFADFWRVAMNAEKHNPVADDSSGITSPRRKLTVITCGDSSQCTMVGPWFPQTLMARVWPISAMSGAIRALASLTASILASEASPNFNAAGPKS